MEDQLPQEIKDALNKAKYGWTKWGGANQGLVQKNLTDSWYCQTCNEEQTKDLPPYMYEFIEREYIRICSKCHNIRLRKDIHPLEFTKLTLIVRTEHDEY